MTLYISLILILLLGCFIKNQSKTICILFLILLSLTAASCSSNADTYNYYILYIYQVFSEQGIEPVYAMLSKLAYDCSLSYPMFRLILYSLGYILLFETAKQYSNKVGLVIGLYSISLFYIDATQMRSFVASMIFLFSLKYLFSDDIKNIVIYAVLVFVAAMIHTSYLFAFIFLLFKYVKNRRRRIKVYILVVIMAMISYTDFLPQMMYKILHTDKVLRWFSRNMRLGFLVSMSLQIFGYAIVSYCYDNIKGDIKNVDKAVIMNNIKNIYCVSLLMMPLYIFDVTFSRLFRPFAILVYISIAIICEVKNRKALSRIVACTLVVFFSISLLWIEISPHIESVVIPLMTDNIFINHDFSIFY